MNMAKEGGKYNILVIGKTGVGKSSFVNYFLGRDVAKTGTGRPVTERGFYEHPFELDGFSVTLYDSWGLEADKYKDWLDKFENELKQRGADKPVNDWFHSVFYCIAAGGHRVEDADIAIVRQLQAEKYPVSVVLTKSDMIDEEQEKAMKSAICHDLDNVNVIAISSGGKTRSGAIEPFGIDAIRQTAKDDFFASIAMRIPHYLRAMLTAELADWKESTNRQIEEVGFFGGNEKLARTKEDIKARIHLIERKLTGRLENILKAYDKIMQVAGISIENLESENKRNKLVSNEVIETLIKGSVVSAVAFAALLLTVNFFVSQKTASRDALRKFFDEIYPKVEHAFQEWIDNVEKDLINLKNRMRDTD